MKSFLKINIWLKIVLFTSLFLQGLTSSAQQNDLVLSSYNNEMAITALNSITLKPGFHIPSGKTVTISLFQGYPTLTSLPTAGQNYILTRSFREPVKIAALNNTRTIAQENQTIQYFDGLGRPLQTVKLMGSPTYQDIVQHTEYDGFGREATQYLPYAEPSGANGSFKTNAKVNQANFYKVGGGWDATVAKTAHPYATTVFENSPLNRVLEQGAPGAAWQPIVERESAAATGHTVVSAYGSNVAGDVRLWTIGANGATGTGTYPAGKLYKTVSKDENWIGGNGKGGTVEEYKDFDGRIVLKRVWESNTKALDTYYVYDDFSDLRYVLPPAVTASSFTETSADAFFNKYIYAYHYDARRRLIEKKIPGKGWEYFAYNANDLEVLRQDSLQRASGSWTYTKYDAFGRVAYSGIYTKAGLNTQASAQTEVNNYKFGNVQYLWEDRTDRKDYTDRAYPKVGSVTTAHVTNYYDDYTFRGADTTALQASEITPELNAKTLLTGTRVTNVDGGAPLWTINYYDKRGQLIQSAAHNHVSGTDFVTNAYNFSGELLTSKRQHRSTIGSTTKNLIVLTTHSYDHVGRLETTRKKIDTQPEILQSALHYNEIGQLVQKELHGSGTSAAQQIVYRYNERGWMTAINDPAAISAKKRFGTKLNYANNVRAYNGNIGSISWNSLVGTGQIQTPVQGYSYSYDMLNRLKKAAYTATNKNNFYNEELAYDVMGNIDTLRRTNGSTGWYNHFKYTYSGNQLSKVTDTGLAKHSNSFTYNGNGSARTNESLAITNIEYNYLNLPKRFVKGSENLVYTYDATGAKQTKTLGTAVTQYVDGVQYKNGAIEFIQTEEGRILPNGSSYIYEYFLTDHLGNTRAIIDHTGALKQLQDYYAFGMEMNTGGGLNAASNLYKYNGKEKQTELQLDQLDYGARFYDAEIGRWNVVDPMSEKYRRWSPYNYAVNNPIRYIDPDGRDIIIFYQERASDGRTIDKTFKFDGTNAKSAPKNGFVNAFLVAYNYNIKNGGGNKMLEAATNSDIQINLQQSDSNKSGSSTVFWNPNEAAQYESNTGEPIVLSPATMLEHEMDHSVSKAKDISSHRERRNTPDREFENKEERRVTTGSEKETATRNGEMKEGQYRSSHNQRKSTIPVQSPISTKSEKYPWDVIIYNYNNEIKR